MMAALFSESNTANGAGGASESDDSEQFFDAPASFEAVSALPNTYSRVRNPDDAENAPNTELSIIKLAREILGSVKVGADVTNINLPASILDPVSTLEKATKSMQRGDLVPDICAAGTPLDRLIAILRFNLSGLAKERFGKKPYNPVLGEIFRCAFAHRNRQHGTTVLIAEQVSHHPPITALHLNNRALGFRLNSYTAPEPRFWGNSLELKLKGSIRVTLDCFDGEEYLITRPVVHMTGFLAGRQRLEFSGPAQIVCKKTGYCADLEFKARGMLGRNDQHAISGRIYEAATDETLYTFDGFWDNEVILTDARSGNESVLFNYNEVKATKSMLPVLPVESELEPSFSTVVWSECSDAIWRANTADANAAKRKVEDCQREKKKQRQASGTSWEYHYFKKRTDGEEGYLLRDDLEGILEPTFLLPSDSMDALRDASFGEIGIDYCEEIAKPEISSATANGKEKKGSRARRKLGALARGRKSASTT